MRSYQIHESGNRNRTDYIGGGSDHDTMKLLAWIVIIVILALALLAVNGYVGIVIDSLVGG